MTGREITDPRALASGRHRQMAARDGAEAEQRAANGMSAHRAHEAARMRAKMTDPAKAYEDLVDGLNWAHVRAGKPALGVLSDQVAYSKATLSKVFTGKAMPSWVLVQRLGRHLNVPPGVVQAWYGMWTAANMPRRRADRPGNGNPGGGTTGTGAGKTGYPCEKCGSWVVDTARHEGWHGEIEAVSSPQAPPATDLTRIGRTGRPATI